MRPEVFRTDLDGFFQNGFGLRRLASAGHRPSERDHRRDKSGVVFQPVFEDSAASDHMPALPYSSANGIKALEAGSFARVVAGDRFFSGVGPGS